MLKASRLVPGGTSDSVNAGGFDEQRATPVHEKLSDIAIASEQIDGSDRCEDGCDSRDMEIRSH
jgi:hypothetical protein